MNSWFVTNNDWPNPAPDDMRPIGMPDNDWRFYRRCRFIPTRRNFNLQKAAKAEKEAEGG